MIKRFLGLIGVHLLGVSLLAVVSGCSSSEGVPGENGADAEPCTVTEGEDGEATIECPDGSSATVSAGADGLPGDPGDPGEDGAPGEDGDPGENGAPGEQGEEGDPGENGAPGDDGDQGAPGQDGEPGSGCSVVCEDEQTVRIFCEDGHEVVTHVDSCVVDGGPLGVLPAEAALAGTVGDATNPELALKVRPGGAPVEALVVTAVSSDESVIPTANITVEGTGRQRSVSFEPAAAGEATITFTVTNDDGDEATATVDYFVSGEAPDLSGCYYYGISDASTAIDVGEGYMLLAGDGDNLIGLYRQDESGTALRVWDFTADEQLGATPVRIEASARHEDTIVWVGSHANAPNGDAYVRSRVIFGTTVSGSGADVELVFSGRYGGGPGTDEEVAGLGLWTDAIDRDVADGFGWGANVLELATATQAGVLPVGPDGFKIEAFEFENGLWGSGTTTTGYLSTSRYGYAMISVTNILDLVDGVGDQSGRAEFGAPLTPFNANIRTIRAMRRNASGDFLIVTSPPATGVIPGDNDVWELYTWNGSASTDAVLNRVLPNPDGLVGGEWEGIASVPDPIVPGAEVRLIADSGDTNFYGTGKTSELEKALQKSYSQEFTLN